MNRLQQLDRYRQKNKLKTQKEIYRQLVTSQQLKLEMPTTFEQKVRREAFLKILKKMERV